MSNQSFLELQQLVRSRLNDAKGDDWLQSQTWRSIVNFSQEEVYELIDAIEQEDFAAVQDELADWCFHLLIYAEMARKESRFDLEQIAQTAIDKLTQRLPVTAASADQSHVHWQQQKYRHKQQHQGSILADLPADMPALLQAKKLQDAVASIGFVFSDVEAARAKLQEELEELDCAIQANDQQQVQHELGDVLFACVAIAKQYAIHPEQALRQTNSRFKQRVHHMEQHAQSQQMDLFALDTAELLALYEQAKQSSQSA